MTMRDVMTGIVLKSGRELGFQVFVDEREMMHLHVFSGIDFDIVHATLEISLNGHTFSATENGQADNDDNRKSRRKPMVISTS